MLFFKLFHHFLLFIIRGRFKIMTVLDTFGDAFLTILGLVFMSSFIADRTRGTRFISSLINDCSILGFQTFPRVILVTRRAFDWLVTFRSQSSIDRLVGEHFLSYLCVDTTA